MYIISISHKTAPVKIREQFTFSKEEQEEFIQQIVKRGHIQECVIVSTCNRSEIYFNGDTLALQVMQQYLAEYKQMHLPELMKYFLIYSEDKANHHLFQVACGMDSMVIGEDEILGQVKTAYERARGLGATKYQLNTLFQAAITCAKKVKTATRLSKTPVSIGTLVANEVLQYEAVNKQILIIGITGKMGTIIAKNLAKKQNVAIVGTSRRHNSILGFCKAESNVTMINYDDRYSYMDQADIIISATTSPHYTVIYQELEQHIKTDKERLFIDLAVPMDIDKEVTKLKKAALHDIDYYGELSKNNSELKLKESFQAQLIIEEHLEDIQKELYFHDFVKDIPEVKQKLAPASFEGLLYQIKERSSSSELSTVLEVLRRVADLS